MKKLLSAFIVLLPLLSMAHPGHDDDHQGGYTIIHYFTSPQHMMFPAIALLGVVLLIKYERNKRKQFSK